jgi:type IV pilus assembly protein PilB
MYRDQEQLLQALVQHQVLKSTDADAVRAKATQTGEAPEAIIVADALASEDQIAQVKSELLKLPLVDLTGKQIPHEVLELISEDVANNYQMVAFELSGKQLHVGMVNPQDFKALEAVEFLAQKSNLVVVYHLITKTHFQAAVAQYRELGDEASEALSRLSEDEALDMPEIGADTPIQDVIKSAPVSKMVLVIMRHAIDGRASDIHIEPSLKDSRVRYRIDGMLRTSLVLPKYVHAAIVARIKVLASLRLDETRMPQDGRIRITIGTHAVDFRVSTMPVAEGEKVVMRVLDTTTAVPTLEELGFHPVHIQQIREGMFKPHGLSLLTGPTGSGKTTTLYTVLTMLNQDGVNIVTLEDPIEYYIAGVNQSQINSEVGHTFATGLRSILRQDPNIIMLGEIRDKETTELVIQSSLTGHLVFSTLHTNNAIGTFGRLIDLGGEPFLLASVIEVIIAQRLARKVCGECTAPDPVPEQMQKWVQEQLASIPKRFLEHIDITKPAFARGKGCARCANQGYKGRVACAEVVTATPAIRELINKGSDTKAMAEALKNQEFITLTQDALLKALQGITTLEEVMRVSQV